MIMAGSRKTGALIVYLRTGYARVQRTKEIIPVEQLYEYCKIARDAGLEISESEE